MSHTPAQFAVLLEHAINELYHSSQDEGCCYKCCGPCSVIYEKLNDGTLDQAVSTRANGSIWWDDELEQVDRKFLHDAWCRVSCHE